MFFYGIRAEETDSGDDEPNEHQQQGPHDIDRCEAGGKDTCRRCSAMRQSN
jgi:hypothetical protein